MSLKERFQITCPECGGSITVDATTGEVLAHRAASRKATPGKDFAGKDFDSLLAGLGDAKSRAEEIFDQQVNAVRDHDRLMEEKFREAMKRAEEDKTEGPPVRPWDLE